MPQEISGLVYDMQPFSVQDGPGIRTTVFLKAARCTAPGATAPITELQAAAELDRMRCIGTAVARRTASRRAARTRSSSARGGGRDDAAADQYVHVKRDVVRRLRDCTSCAFRSALHLRTRYTVEEIMAKVRPTGRTSSAPAERHDLRGEALSQIDFTVALLKQLKAEGFHTVR
jgi:pyruvate formate lyase activating enzyme